MADPKPGLMRELEAADLASSSTLREQPVFFDSGDDSLLGFLTGPAEKGERGAALVLSGGTRQTSMGRNRLIVRLSRRISDAGLHAFRFDYHGVGESTGAIDRFSLAAPFVDDLSSATTWVEQHDLTAEIYVGICFGARTVLEGIRSAPSLRGVVLVEPPVRNARRGGRRRYATSDLMKAALKPWIWAGLADRDRRAYYAKFVRSKLRARRTKEQDSKEREDLSWVGSAFLDALEELVDRRVSVLIIYGTGGVNHLDFEAARAGRLGDIVARAGDLVDVITFPGELHGFSDLSSQERVIDAIDTWLSGVMSSRRSSFDEDGGPDA